MDDQTLHEHLGFPSKEQQAIYDETQRRIQAKRDKFFGKTSAVVEIDYDKLTPEGKQLRENVGKAISKANATPQASRLDSILSRVLSRRIPPRPLALPFEEAQIVVEAIYENDLAGRNRLPFWTPQQSLILEKVTRYFIGDPGDPTRMMPNPNPEPGAPKQVPVDWIPLSANLYMYGNVGVGKTFLMDVMQILCESVPIPEMNFQNVSTKAIMLAVHNSKSMSPLDYLKKGNLLIDDLGAEDRSEVLWGKKKDPMDYILDFRYRSYIRKGIKTHFTSNKQPDELESIYGTRNYDRMTEMGLPIFFPGESKRPPADEE